MLWLTTVFYPLLMVEPQNLLLKPLKLPQHLCPSTVLHNSRHRLQWREKRNIKRSQPIQKRCKQILFKQLLKLPWVAFCNAQENILPSLLPSHAYRFWTPPPHTHIHPPPPVKTDFNLNCFSFYNSAIETLPILPPRNFICFPWDELWKFSCLSDVYEVIDAVSNKF